MILIDRLRHARHRLARPHAALERRRAHQDLVEQGAEAVDVGRLGRRGAGQHLGRAARDLAAQPHHGRHQRRHGEVGDPDAPVAADRDAVDGDDAVRQERRRRGERPGHVREDVHRPLGAETDGAGLALAVEQLAQRVPLDQLRGDVRVLPLDRELDHLGDVLVVQRRGAAHRLGQLVDHLPVLDEARVDDVQAERRACGCVGGLVDVGEHPLAVALAYGVAAPGEASTGRETPGIASPSGGSLRIHW